MINRFLHSRSAVLVLFVLAVISTIAAWSSGHLQQVVGDSGIVFDSPNEWISSQLLSFILSIVFNGLICSVSLLISKNYNPMRSSSSLFASMFIILQAGSPWALASLNGGTVVSLVVITCIMLLFSVFQNTESPQTVFIIFLILSLVTLCQYAFALYIPIMIVGLAQMKIFNLRNILAALIGIITPLWILLGFGIIDFSNFEWPEIINIFEAYKTNTIFIVLSTTVFTAICGFIFLGANFLKMLSYNSRIRAANGVLILMMFATILFAGFDYSNIAAYLPFLNWLVAYQIGHYFATNTSRRAFWGIIVIFLIYSGFYTWNLLA